MDEASESARDNPDLDRPLDELASSKDRKRGGRNRSKRGSGRSRNRKGDKREGSAGKEEGSSVFDRLGGGNGGPNEGGDVFDRLSSRRRDDVFDRMDTDNSRRRGVKDRRDRGGGADERRERERDRMRDKRSVDRDNKLEDRWAGRLGPLNRQDSRSQHDDRLQVPYEEEEKDRWPDRATAEVNRKKRLAERLERKTRGEFYEVRPDPARGAEVRPEAILIYGTDDWETKDVFSFWGEEYRPDFVEWINDSTCNAVWVDLDNARRGLLKNSEPVLLSDYQTELGIPAENISDEAELLWRRGRAHQGRENILLRYATTDDVKLVGARKRSQWAKRKQEAEEKWQKENLGEAQDVRSAAVPASIAPAAPVTDARSEHFSRGERGDAHEEGEYDGPAVGADVDGDAALADASAVPEPEPAEEIEHSVEEPMAAPAAATHGFETVDGLHHDELDYGDEDLMDMT